MTSPGLTKYCLPLSAIIACIVSPLSGTPQCARVPTNSGRAIANEPFEPRRSVLASFGRFSNRRRRFLGRGRGRGGGPIGFGGEAGEDGGGFPGVAQGLDGLEAGLGKAPLGLEDAEVLELAAFVGLQREVVGLLGAGEDLGAVAVGP